MPRQNKFDRAILSDLNFSECNEQVNTEGRNLGLAAFRAILPKLRSLTQLRNKLLPAYTTKKFIKLLFLNKSMQIQRSPLQAFKLWLASVILYGFGLLFVRFGPHYSWFVEPVVQNFLYYFYLVFFIASIPYYLFTTTRYDSNKPLLFFQFLKNNFSSLQKGKFTAITKGEKTATLFIGVKLFFLPLMFQFLYQNIGDVLNILNKPWTYAFFLIILFALDTALFAFGYTFEFKFLKNKVRSVEPTFFR